MAKTLNEYFGEVISATSRPGGPMSEARPEILLKTDTKTVLLELGREGKFSAKATGWDENKVVKPGEKIEISLTDGPLAPSGSTDLVFPGIFDFPYPSDYPFRFLKTKMLASK
jgi:hypothetical protein